MPSAQVNIALGERALQAVSLIRERYPHLTNTPEAIRAALVYLAFDESPAMYEGWITVEEAGEIMSANSGHRISPQQVRRKADEGYIASRRVQGRGKGGKRFYKRTDVEKVIVQKHGGMYSQTEPPKETVTE